MDVKRVQEIINSYGIIDVEHDGRSIWIQSFDRESGTAVIQDIQNRAGNKIVNISELDEIKQQDA